MFIFGVPTNKSIIREIKAIVTDINNLEGQVTVMNQEEMICMTNELKEKIHAGKMTLNEALPISFALVREASLRVLGLRHYDAQLIGGVVMHRGMIAEMCTGEGKTLVSTLPAYLNSLTGKGVYVVTVNDYLAKRDSEWMGKVHEYLGLSVGCVLHDTSDQMKKAAYACDITYATNNELGFDYLRDNMEHYPENLRQRSQNAFAIIDEVDSILIDEARTPLIISGPSKSSATECEWIDGIVRNLTRDDYAADEKYKSISMKQNGIIKIEEILRQEKIIDENETLYIASCTDIIHSIQQAIKAHALYEKDVDYIVKDGEVLLIDEFTGRIMEGRRYSDGLHQAIEAKEKVDIKNESITLASITYQNYFKLYDKVAGMTGTAATEAEEFKKIYNLNVVQIPTHLPIARKDRNDILYASTDTKMKAVCELVRERHEKGQPILVGTASVDKSEEFSRAFSDAGLPHSTLNARYHEQEAEIIAEAGRIGAITIATNMAGRGTDIKLGGSCEDEKIKVKALGGLLVIGTERNESRRIDNQLRGRAGRQGDPGESVFYIAAQDRIIRLFAGADKKFEELLSNEGADGKIEHFLVDYIMRDLQKKVESYHYDTRKHVLEYDSVLDEQRKIIYKMRQEFLLCSEAICYEKIFHIYTDVIDSILEEYNQRDQDNHWLKDNIERIFNYKMRSGDIENIYRDILTNVFLQRLNEDNHTLNLEVIDAIASTNVGQELSNGDPAFSQLKFGNSPYIVRHAFLQIIDTKWREHLVSMDWLKQQSQLQAYAQKDPLNAYKNEALPAFNKLIWECKEAVCITLSRMNENISYNDTDFDGDSNEDVDKEENDTLDSAFNLNIDLLKLFNKN